jgi:signal transduction histidine kinase
VTTPSEQEAREAYFKERLMAILAHDLRNPLNAITMGADVLRRAPDLGPDSKKVVERIAKGANRMERLIRDVVDLASHRLGGGLPIAKRPVELDPICRQIVDEHELSAPGRVRYVGEAPGAGTWDPDRVAQVLQNLIANALAHGDEASTVLLRATGDAARARVEVTNRGRPIPAELLPVLFDPFRRGRDEKQRGLGLGLFIVEQIAAAHGGTVDVASRDGATTFGVTLPRGEPSASRL